MGFEDCYLDSIDGNAGGVLLEFVLFFYCMAGLAIVCDDHLVVVRFFFFFPGAYPSDLTRKQQQQ